MYGSVGYRVIEFIGMNASPNDEIVRAVGNILYTMSMERGRFRSAVTE